MNDRNEKVVDKFVDVVGDLRSDRTVIEKVTRAIGYECLEHFLDDNPGACDLILEFIAEHANGYVEANQGEPDFLEFVGLEDEDEDEEE